MAENKGYIKIDRKIMDNWIWFDEPFSKGQAWIDLLLNAQFKDGFFKSKKGIINYKRGDCTYSISDLSERWCWTRWKVRKFLDFLQSEKMIERKLVKKTYSIITVLNYDKYQSKERVITPKNNKKDDDFDYEGHLKFLLGDRYEEYMDCKAKGIEFHE